MAELTLDRIHRWMKRYTVTTRMLAEALNYSQEHMRRILKGKCRLMPDAKTHLLQYFYERRVESEQEAALMAQIDQCA